MDTLVLSSAWQPVAAVDWQRAISLFVAGRVEVIEEYDDRFIQTVSVVFNTPLVIRYLTGMAHPQRRGLRFSRQNVYARDRGRCQYCHAHVPRHAATYDHVTPRSRGGQTNWANIVIACLPCNQRKGARTPDEAGMILRGVPMKPRNLPRDFRLTMSRDKGVPKAWHRYVPELKYWYGELDHDPEPDGS